MVGFLKNFKIIAKILATFRNNAYLCSVKTVLRHEVAASGRLFLCQNIRLKRYRSTRVVDTETPTESSNTDFNSA